MFRTKKFSLKISSLYDTAALLFLVLVTVGFSTTSSSSRIYIEFLRNFSIALLLAIILILFLYRRAANPRYVASVYLFVLLVAHGTLFSVINDGFIHISNTLVVNSLMILVALTLFSFSDTGILKRNVVQLYLCYVVLTFFLTIFAGGVIFTYPPHFVFEYSTIQAGGEVVYSQGISKFFGLGAIAAAFLAISGSKRFGSIFYIVIALFLLGLSFLGGGRGDILAALLVTILLILFNKPGKLVSASLVLTIPIVLFLGQVDFKDFSTFNRFMVFLDGNFSLRDQLLADAFRLLDQEPICAIFGCGFGFFQNYYDLPSGLYPHNTFIEAIIVWGAPVTVALAVLTIVGLIKFSRRAKAQDAFIAFFLFFALIDSKGGTILGSWVVFGGAMAFAPQTIISRSRHIGNERIMPSHEDASEK